MHWSIEDQDVIAEFDACGNAGGDRNVDATAVVDPQVVASQREPAADERADALP